MNQSKIMQINWKVSYANRFKLIFKNFILIFWFFKLVLELIIYIKVSHLSFVIYQFASTYCNQNLMIDFIQVSLHDQWQLQSCLCQSSVQFCPCFWIKSFKACFWSTIRLKYEKKETESTVRELLICRCKFTKSGVSWVCSLTF